MPVTPEDLAITVLSGRVSTRGKSITLRSQMAKNQQQRKRKVKKQKRGTGTRAFSWTWKHDLLSCARHTHVTETLSCWVLFGEFSRPHNSSPIHPQPHPGACTLWQIVSKRVQERPLETSSCVFFHSQHISTDISPESVDIGKVNENIDEEDIDNSLEKEMCLGISRIVS